MTVKELINNLQNYYNPDEEIAYSLWTVEDVLDLDSSLTEDEAGRVLERVHNKQDANLGINWDFIESCIKDGLKW